MDKKNEAPRGPRSNAGTTTNLVNNPDTCKPKSAPIQSVTATTRMDCCAFIGRSQEDRAMRKMKAPGIRGMNLYRALAYCAKLTSAVWSKMDVMDTLDLWKVFKAYILNDFQDAGLMIPPRCVDAWGQCKVLIEKEDGR